MDKIVEHYNKFNEEKRLNSRHGQVEYRVSMKYIHVYLDRLKKELGREISILDIGAGTGRYSIPLAEEGYDVTAVEYVKYNLGILKQKSDKVKAYQGNAVKLKRFDDNTFDFTLLFGPMYHLFSREEKVQALREAKRVTKPGGYIFVAYFMNEYGVIRYGFKEKHILESLEKNGLTEDFRITEAGDELYSFVRVEDIKSFSEEVGLKREKLISPDGPANYIRQYLNQLSEEEFEKFVEYQMVTCEREELLGAGAHTVDILKVE